jgi:hypothetical protein
MLGLSQLNSLEDQHSRIGSLADLSWFIPLAKTLGKLT